jgi:outer membrane protein TolC
LKIARLQYQGGETDFTTVLNAQQSALSAEDALASARGNVDQGIIAAYRALGGGWEVREGRELISDEVKAEMKRRTNWGKL